MTWGQIGMEAAMALIPVLVMVLIALIVIGFAYLRKRNQWMAQTQVDEQVEGMAKNVVIGLQQDVVEGLKAANADGKLTPEEIENIKRQAFSTLQQHLTEGQRKVLTTMTGDLSAWLAGTIQRTLVEHKLDVAAATGAQALPLLEAVEFVNPPSVPVSPAS